MRAISTRVHIYNSWYEFIMRHIITEHKHTQITGWGVNNAQTIIQKDGTFIDLSICLTGSTSKARSNKL